MQTVILSLSKDQPPDNLIKPQAMNTPQPLIMWVRDRLALSFLSAWAGWAASLSLFVLSGLYTIATDSKDHLFFGSGDPFNWQYMIEGLFVIGLVMGFYVLFVWFWVLVPLALFVPSKSFFWKPRALTLCGIIAGPSLFIGYILISGGYDFHARTDFMSSLYSCFIVFIVPATIGGVTCYVGSRLNHRLMAKAA